MILITILENLECIDRADMCPYVTEYISEDNYVFMYYAYLLFLYLLLWCKYYNISVFCHLTTLWLVNVSWHLIMILFNFETFWFDQW